MTILYSKGHRALLSVFHLGSSHDLFLKLAAPCKQQLHRQNRSEPGVTAAPSAHSGDQQKPGVLGGNGSATKTGFDCDNEFSDEFKAAETL